MGTLGLAWTGDLKNAGGVCEKNGVRIPTKKKEICSVILTMVFSTNIRIFLALSWLTKITQHWHCDVAELWKACAARSITCYFGT